MFIVYLSILMCDTIQGKFKRQNVHNATLQCLAELADLIKETQQCHVPVRTTLHTDNEAVMSENRLGL